MCPPPKFLETPNEAPRPNEIPNELFELLAPDTLDVSYEMPPKAKFNANEINMKQYEFYCFMYTKLDSCTFFTFLFYINNKLMIPILLMQN